MAQLAANPLLNIPTPGQALASSTVYGPSKTLTGSLAGLGGSIAAKAATPALLSAAGLAPGLASGAGLASSLGLGAGIGSIIPGIGTLAGLLVSAFLPNLFKQNRSAMGDISAAEKLGRPISSQSWNQAGYAPGGGYLTAEQLLSPASGQKNNAPLRDIADALYNGASISDASWQKAGLASGGGAYGAYLEKAMQAIRGDAGQLNLPTSINSSGLGATQLASLSKLLPQYA